MHFEYTSVVQLYWSILVVMLVAIRMWLNWYLCIYSVCGLQFQ